MKNNVNEIVKKLIAERSLSLEEYKTLIESYSEENAKMLAEYAVAERKNIIPIRFSYEVL